MLKPADRDRIHHALAQAEASTSGEIFCVVAQASARYRDVPLAWAAGVSMLAPPVALLLGLRPAAAVQALLLVVQSGWSVAQAGAVNAMVMAALVGYAALQAVLFALVLGLLSLPGVRARLTPAGVKRQAVHTRAMEQFFHRLHAAHGTTGVLIYASLEERRVEIIAEEAVDEKVAAGRWDEAVQAALGPIRAGDMAGGLAAAIAVCGRALAEHFPAREGAPPPAVDDRLAEV
jgi:putative membrane protein